MPPRLGWGVVSGEQRDWGSPLGSTIRDDRWLKICLPWLLVFFARHLMPQKCCVWQDIVSCRTALPVFLMFVSCSGFSRFLKVQMKSSGILTELEQYHTAAHCSRVTGTKRTIPILPSYCCQAPHIWCSLAWQTQGRILGSQNSPHLFEQMPLGCDTFMWTKCRAQTAACKRGKKSKFSPKDKKALGGSMKERQTKMKTTCKCFAASGTSCSSSKSAHKADLGSGLCPTLLSISKMALGQDCQPGAHCSLYLLKAQLGCK